jgi:hypothetical protein
MTEHRHTPVLAALLVTLFWGTAAYAEPVEETDEELVDGYEQLESPPEPTPEPPTVPARRTLPDDPRQRVAMAEQAFHSADFELLRPLLEPLVEGPITLTDVNLRQQARRLLAVGLFFEAQQVPDATSRAGLLALAREHLLAILRDDPDSVLDPMIFPASVVELYEDVRQSNATELEDILRARRQTPRAQGYELQTLYIEREVRSNHLVLALFPLGIGQFQNRSPVKGTLFAVGQIASLTLNVLSYYMIERLRGPDGTFDTRGDLRGGNYARALAWRNAQFSGLGAFAALYGWSLIDGLIHFEPYYIHIRTLDEAPPELAPPTAGQPALHHLGWSLRLSW